MVKGVLSVLVLGLAISTTACHHNVNASTKTPPSPQVAAAITLTDASNTCKTLEDALTTADHAIDLVQTSDPEYYAHAGALFKKISAANRLAADKVNTSIQGKPENWQAAFAGIGSSVDLQDLSSVQIKNPNSQLLVSASIAALLKILTALPHQ